MRFSRLDAKSVSCFSQAGVAHVIDSKLILLLEVRDIFCTLCTVFHNNKKVSRDEATYPSPTAVRRGISILQPPSEFFSIGADDGFVAVSVTSIRPAEHCVRLHISVQKL